MSSSGWPLDHQVLGDLEALGLGELEPAVGGLQPRPHRPRHRRTPRSQYSESSPHQPSRPSHPEPGEDLPWAPAPREAGCTSGYRAGRSAAVGLRERTRRASLKPGERTLTPPLTGTLTGVRIGIARWRGHVVVINVWGSWCAPCRKEAPELARLAKETKPLGVRFLGVDIRDSKTAAIAFEKDYGITYPSSVSGRGTRPPSPGRPAGRTPNQPHPGAPGRDVGSRRRRPRRGHSERVGETSRDQGHRGSFAVRSGWAGGVGAAGD